MQYSTVYYIIDLPGQYSTLKYSTVITSQASLSQEKGTTCTEGSVKKRKWEVGEGPYGFGMYDAILGTRFFFFSELFVVFLSSFATWKLHPTMIKWMQSNRLNGMFDRSTELSWWQEKIAKKNWPVLYIT